jgi:hypothetical protein
MRTLDEAFAKFKSRLELKEKEQTNASDRHREVRDHLKSKFDIRNDFLTGSYARWTKTKPLKDVDIFCPLGDKDKHYRDAAPSVVLADFESALIEKYGSSMVSRQRRSCTVDFGVTADAEEKTDYKIMSVDVVPAFKSGENYEIPDADTAEWIMTNPKVHADKAIAAQRAYNDQWKAIVRMLKYWNNHNGKPIKPSFLIEVMCLDCLSGGFGGRWDYEFQSIFATLAEQIHHEWKDPAGLGPAVSDSMDSSKKDGARLALESAQRSAAQAIHLARQGKNYEAQKAWRALFGPIFPHP